jgi:hypothetical protein
VDRHNLENCLHFLRRVVVHGVEQERLLETVDALERELLRRKTRSANPKSDKVL